MAGEAATTIAVEVDTMIVEMVGTMIVETEGTMNVCQNPRPGWRGSNKARPAASSDSHQRRSYSPRNYHRGSSSQDREVQSQLREYIDLDRAKKEEKNWKKEERKEVKKREEAERLQAEVAKEAKRKKAEKKVKKAQMEEEKYALMSKDMRLEMKSEMCEFKDEMRAGFLKIVAEGQKLLKGKGKQPGYVSDECQSSHRYARSNTEELTVRTNKLTLKDKRKRGPKVYVGDNPPIEGSTKRTSRRSCLKTGGRKTLRVVASKAKRRVKLSPTFVKKLASAVKMKKPTSSGLLGRYRYRSEEMARLKRLDAITLHKLCNDKGVPYNGKIETIFDLANHRTYIAFGPKDKEENDPVEELEEEEGPLEEEETNEEDTAVCEDLGVAEYWRLCRFCNRLHEKSKTMDPRIKKIEKIKLRDMQIVSEKPP
ncbi:hypothetical protein CBR_g38832 [Chara braunii]|uniref:Uncharacterized protein n=1 Tax=Chara braunii TaxID=69332 RepID=A0A388LQD3_CHABU|nr:hypothetical protein CBR_g38832 [Chara braunii]|eukprot:GBG84550.1 hypothetical protein CBR_g38832 [Chara braunii]